MPSSAGPVCFELTDRDVRSGRLRVKLLTDTVRGDQTLQTPLVMKLFRVSSLFVTNKQIIKQQIKQTDIHQNLKKSLPISKNPIVFQKSRETPKIPPKICSSVAWPTIGTVQNTSSLF